MKLKARSSIFFIERATRTRVVSHRGLEKCCELLCVRFIHGIIVITDGRSYARQFVHLALTESMRQVPKLKVIATMLHTQLFHRGLEVALVGRQDLLLSDHRTLHLRMLLPLRVRLGRLHCRLRLLPLGTVVRLNAHHVLPTLVVLECCSVLLLVIIIKVSGCRAPEAVSRAGAAADRRDSQPRPPLREVGSLACCRR